MNVGKNFFSIVFFLQCEIAAGSLEYVNLINGANIVLNLFSHFQGRSFVALG